MEWKWRSHFIIQFCPIPYCYLWLILRSLIFTILSINKVFWTAWWYFQKRAINMCMPCHIANRNWTAVLKQARNLHESVETNGGSRILILSKTLGDKDTLKIFFFFLVFKGMYSLFFWGNPFSVNTKYLYVFERRLNYSLLPCTCWSNTKNTYLRNVYEQNTITCLTIPHVK